MKKFFTLIAAAMVAVAANAGVIWQFNLTVPESNVSVDPGSEVELDNYATWTNQDVVSVSICNGHSSKAANMITTDGLAISNSGGSYIQISDLKTPLMEGDVITVNGGKECRIGVEFDKTSSDNTVDGSFTCTAAFAGKKGFYICRGAGKPTAITTITIERNANQVIAPSFTVVGKTLVMTSSTEGAKIYYGTASGETTTEYTAPIEFSETTTYYAIAKKDGMDDSKEVSKTVEYYAIPATATLAATLKSPEATEADVELENITVNGFVASKKESDAVLSNTATYAIVEGQPIAAYEGLVKVKKTIIITAPEGKNIVGIKVKGISNANGATQAVTAEGMKFTTDNNILPARDNAEQQPGIVELVAETPAQAFNVYFSSQARVLFEVYADDVDAVVAVEAAPAAAVAPVKTLVNGQVVIVKDGAVYTVTGAQMK